MPSLPLIPTPTWAVCIIPTSFAPSPIASVMALTCFFTMSTISDFCSGDTLQKKIRHTEYGHEWKQESYLESERVKSKMPAVLTDRIKLGKLRVGNSGKWKEKDGWKAGRSTHGSVYCSSPGIRKQWFTVLLMSLCIVHGLCVYIRVCACPCISESTSECVCSGSFQWYSTLLTCITDPVSITGSVSSLTMETGRLDYRRFPPGPQRHDGEVSCCISSSTMAMFSFYGVMYCICEMAVSIPWRSLSWVVCFY